MMSKIRSQSPAVGFERAVSVLAGGTALGQAITILAAPVLTRLFGPEDFGLLAIYSAIIGIAGALAALSYHQAIPLPEHDEDAAQVLGVSVASTLGVVGLVTVGVVVGGDHLAAVLGAPALKPYLWMVPIGVLGLALYEVLMQWAVRRRDFSAIARTAVAKGVAQTGTQLGLGFASGGPFGLLLGQLLGQWTGSGGLLGRAIKGSAAAIRSVSFNGMCRAARRYSRFPKYTSPSVLFNVVGVDAPPLLLSYYFGGVVTGHYALGARVLMMPVTLVAKSTSQVFFSSAPGYLREGRLGEQVELLFARMLRLGMAPVVILAISGPALFAFVFGEEWQDAGVYVRWLSPWLLMVFVTFGLGPLVSVLERQRAGFIFQGVLSAIRIGALVLGGLIGQALLAIALFGVASGMCWAVYLVWLLNVGGASLTSSGSVLIREVLWSVPFAIPVAGCQIAGAPDIAIIIVVAACSLASIYRAIVISRAENSSASVGI